MAHITLSVPDETLKEMKRYPHIKWSEAARKGIDSLLKQLKGYSTSKEILEELSSDFREWVKTVDEKQAKKFYEKQRKLEWKRLKSLTRAH